MGIIKDWLARKLQIRSEKSAKEDLERFYHALKGMDDHSMGMVVIFATKIRIKMLDNNVLKPGALGEGIPCDEMTRMKCMIKIGNLARCCQKEGEDIAASGFLVWYHSLRAICHLPIRYIGIEMWNEIKRGFPFGEEAISEIIAGRTPLPAFTISEEMIGTILAEYTFVPPFLEKS